MDPFFHTEHGMHRYWKEESRCSRSPNGLAQPRNQDFSVGGAQTVTGGALIRVTSQVLLARSARSHPRRTEGILLLENTSGNLQAAVLCVVCTDAKFSDTGADFLTPKPSGWHRCQKDGSGVKNRAGATSTQHRSL